MCMPYSVNAFAPGVQVTGIAKENLEKVIRRGDNLEDLQGRAGGH